jgi:hypothetical protein
MIWKVKKYLTKMQLICIIMSGIKKREVKIMANLTQYVHDNFTMPKEALDLIDNICDWAFIHYKDNNGNLNAEGLHFVALMLDGVADMWYDEIKEAWRYDG